MEGLINQRNSEHGIDPVLLQVALDILQPVGDDDGGASRQSGKDFAGEGKGVVDGQDQKPPGFGIDVHPPQHVLHVGSQVPVGEHDALGGAGGAGGEIDSHQGFRVDLPVHIPVVPFRDQRIAFLHQLFQGQVPPLVGVPVHFDQVFHEIQVRHGGVHCFLLFFRINQRRGFRPAQEIHQFCRRQFPVQGNDHAHAATDGKIGQRPVVPVFAHYGDLLAFQPPVQQGRPQGIHVLLQLPVGNGPAVALSREMPVFEGGPLTVVFRTVADDVPDIGQIPDFVRFLDEFTHSSSPPFRFPSGPGCGA